jgi:hypothetical protein
LRKDFTLIYLLKRKELLVLHLHHSSRDVVVPETLLELDPSEACRRAAAVEEVVAECGFAAEPEQCCSE